MLKELRAFSHILLLLRFRSLSLSAAIQLAADMGRVELVELLIEDDDSSEAQHWRQMAMEKSDRRTSVSPNKVCVRGSVCACVHVCACARVCVCLCVPARTEVRELIACSAAISAWAGSMLVRVSEIAPAR